MRILAVDDDVAALRAMSRLLVREGHEVESAQDGDEAIEAIAHGEKFDVMLLDLNMPGKLDGYDLLRMRRVWRRLAEVAVVIVSGATEEELRQRGHLEGVACWFSKPVDFSRLLATLQSFERSTVPPPPREE